MLEGESLVGPINEPPSALLSDIPVDPVSVTSSPTYSSSDKSPLADLSNAWKKSVTLKVLTLIVVIALVGMIVLIVTMNLISNGLGDCKNKLESEELQTQQCLSKESTLKTEIQDLENDLSKKQIERTNLQSKKNELEKDNKKLQEEILELDKEIGNLNNENREVEGRISKLEGDKARVVDEIRKIDILINTVNKEINSTKTEIKKLDALKIWYIAGVAALGLTDALAIYQAYSVSTELKAEEERLAHYTAENKRIQTEINNHTTELKKLEEEKKKLEDEYSKLHEKLRECDHNKAQIISAIRDCEDRKKAVEHEMLATKTLAIEQAKAYYLMTHTDYLVERSVVYNSTKDGFRADTFNNHMQGTTSSVVILNTTNGRIFGIGTGFNQGWPKENRKYTMDGAFTFSTRFATVCHAIIHKDNFELKDNYFFQLGPPEVSVQTNGTYAHGIATTTNYFNCEGHPDNLYDAGQTMTYSQIYGYNIKMGK
jgi:septal ring factor EnvC (AmiA/AmiB activator)